MGKGAGEHFGAEPMSDEIDEGTFTKQKRETVPGRETARSQMHRHRDPECFV